ncbi:hypothetical protein [Carboxylicivirga sp. M1479]|uniref:hypothetical protein n=1 Tax=Carboxylicivirga sp. M1479 TaxID=2594476 RepID=UPI00163DDB38|nr:hypothetical protein [Carboxylicivirga sp. M1479]
MKEELTKRELHDVFDQLLKTGATPYEILHEFEEYKFNQIRLKKINKLKNNIRNNEQ